MKATPFLIVLALAPVVSACSRQSDMEYLNDLQTRQLQGCVAAVPDKVRQISSATAKSICTCGFDRLVAHHSIKTLREIDEGKDQAAAERIMRPIMQECLEAEVARN